MIKLWKCEYVITPKYGCASKVIDYVWSTDYPSKAGQYWTHLMHCEISDLYVEGIEPHEGMTLNVKVMDIVEVE